MVKHIKTNIKNHYFVQVTTGSRPKATDQETLEKLGRVLMEIGEDIKRDWAGRVEDWTGGANQEMMMKELGECWEESKGDKNKMRDCMVRDFVTWVKVFQSADGIICILDSRGDVDKLLACKSNGARVRLF